MSKPTSKESAEEAVAEVVDPGFQPVYVTDPPPPVEAPSNKPPTVPRGYVLVVYTGSADVVEYGEHRFRPGQPVAVPSEAAEELLTHTSETFTAKE